MRPPPGIERSTLTACEVHFSREPIGEQRAEHEDSAQHGNGHERIRQPFHSAESCAARVKPAFKGFAIERFTN